MACRSEGTRTATRKPPAGFLRFEVHGAVARRHSASHAPMSGVDRRRPRMSVDAAGSGLLGPWSLTCTYTYLRTFGPGTSQLDLDGVHRQVFAS